MLTNVQLFKFGLIATAMISLAACESSGSYRLASVGNVPDGSGGGGTASGGGDGSGGSGGTGSGNGTGSSSGGMGSGNGTGSSSGGSGSSSSSGGIGTLGNGILVTAGNTVIGVAGKNQQLANSIDGKVPALTPVNATVTRVLTKTGQTLVNLGNGNSLILNKAGGHIGDVVKIDLGSKTVIGAPSESPLLGVGVLSPTGSGNLATVSSSALPGTGSLSGVTGAVGAVAAPVTTTISTVTGGVTAGAGANGSLTTPITAVTGGATAGTSLTTTVTTTVGGVLGGLKPKK